MYVCTTFIHTSVCICLNIKKKKIKNKHQNNFKHKIVKDISKVFKSN